MTPVCEMRARLRRSLCQMPRRTGTVYRPELDEFGAPTGERTALGRVSGYPYSKAQAVGMVVLALPGQLTEAEKKSDRLMVLYGSRNGAESCAGIRYDPPDAHSGDIFAVDGGGEYRITDVQDAFGIYQVYALERM